MWIAFPGGFVSIVEKPADVGNDTLTVRARDKQSLAAFCTVATGTEVSVKSIKLKLATDYPYRRVLPRAQAEAAAVEIVRSIDYSNFKTEAKRVRGAVYAGVLGRVWSALLGLEDKATRDAVNDRWAKQAPLLPATYDVPDEPPTDLDTLEVEELDALDNIVAEFGVAALTDAQWARYEQLGG